MLRGIPLLLAGMLAASLLATESDAMPHMAVVNISQVFNAYARVRAAETALDKIFGPQRAEMAAEKKKLQLWEDKIKLDGRDIKTNLDFYKEVQLFGLKRFEFDLKLHDFEQRVVDHQKNEMKSILDDINGAIAAITSAEKIDIVFRAADDTPTLGITGNDEVKEETAETMMQKLRSSTVVKYSPKMDLTPKIILRLNEDYEKGRQ